MPETVADYLHAQVFGRHFHACPSRWCKGRSRSCSEQYDCQPGPKLCSDCYFFEEEDLANRRAWRQVDRALQVAVCFEKEDS